MPSVFVNYRNADALPSAVLVERELSRSFGSEEIFRAGKSIPAGQDFEQYLLRTVRKCAILVALIGPRWLDEPGPKGGRAIDDPDDWVRREIAEAFDNGLTVIPLFLDRTARLNKEGLPDDIAQLAGRQYLTLSHRTPDSDLDRLVKTIRATLPELDDPQEEQRRSRRQEQRTPTASTSGSDSPGTSGEGEGKVATTQSANTSASPSDDNTTADRQELLKDEGPHKPQKTPRKDSEIPPQQFGSVIGGIGPNSGYQGQVFGGTVNITTQPGPAQPPDTDLPEQLTALREVLRAARDTEEMSSGEYTDAVTLVDEATGSADAAAQGAGEEQGKVLRALRKLAGLTAHVASVAAVVNAALAMAGGQ